MKVEVITLFPEIFHGFLSSSLIQKAQQNAHLEVRLTQLRDYADPPHYHVDDTPYGGGAGMVLMAEPLARAIEDAKRRLPNAEVALLSPAGAVFSQKAAYELSEKAELIFVCGRYEGIDQRIVDLLIDREISLGDFVLMGGEVATMAVLEASVRLIDGVLGNQDSKLHESFGTKGQFKSRLEAPQYTRPAEFRGKQVPEVLLSGDHKRIENWRAQLADELTAARRPDLLESSDD